MKIQRKHLALLVSLIILLLVVYRSPQQRPLPRPTIDDQPVWSRFYKSYFPLVSNGDLSPRPQRTLFGYGLDWKDSAYPDEWNRKLNAVWVHQWLIRPGVTELYGLEFVQHLYCNGKGSFDRLQQHVDMGYAGYILFLNEPDMHDQCNITPAAGVDALVKARDICPSCLFIGAQVSHIDAAGGFQWLRAFYEEANRRGVRLPEYAGLHTYLPNPPYSGTYILDTFYQLAEDVNYTPQGIWFTEIGGDSVTAVAGMAQACTGDPLVQRCAYFSPVCDPDFSWWWFNQHYCLMGLDGTLNEKGVVWSNLTR